MSEHTPGPWKRRADTNGWSADSPIGRSGSASWEPIGGAGRRDPVCLVVQLDKNEYRDGDAALEANARLIAAAPDMLEALREAELQIAYLHDKFAKTGTGEAALVKIRSALAKASA